MKKLSLFLILLLLPFAMQAQVKWMSLEEAMQQQKAEPKKVFLFFYHSGKEATTTMEHGAFAHPVIQNLINANYYPVKFDVTTTQPITWNGRTFSSYDQATHIRSGFHQFAQFMNVNAVPSSVFLDTAGMPMTIIQGALNAAELEPYLQFMSVNKAQSGESAVEWQTFLKNFKPKVKLRTR